MAKKNAVEAPPANKEAPKSVTAPVPVPALDWSVAGVTGFENVQARDLGIPFLVIVQSGSPEIKAGHPKHAQQKIEGAVEGSVINTVSRAILYQPKGEPFEVIPLYWDKLFIEWKPRTSSGGGFVTAHRDEMLLSRCRKNDKNQDVLPNNNLLVPTAYFYVLVKNPDAEVGAADEFSQAIIGMSSTQLKASRTWLNISQSLKVQNPAGKRVTPPLFSHSYLISTEPQSNDKGAWMGWKIEVGEPITDAALADQVITQVRACREFAMLNAPVNTSNEPDSDAI